MQTKEQIAAYKKAWREANKEQIAAYKKVWRDANKEKIAGYRKAFYVANREKELAQCKIWRTENHENVLTKHKIYHAAHPDEHCARQHKYRAQKAGVNIGDPKAILAWLKSWKTETPVACHYCKKVAPGTEMTVDHVIPMSAGGPHDLTNIVVCCPSCNSSKQDKLPEVWLAKTG